MKKWQKIFALLGRVFISLLFILSAIHKIIDWQESEHGLMNFLLDWQSYASFSAGLQNFLGYVLDWIPVLLVFLITLQLAGGVLLFLGIKIRLAASFLVIFLIFSLILFHPFWFFSGLKKQIELNLFLKDLAIMGGLLYVLAWGAKKEEKNKGPEINLPGGPNFPNLDSSLKK